MLYEARRTRRKDPGSTVCSKGTCEKPSGSATALLNLTFAVSFSSVQRENEAGSDRHLRGAYPIQSFAAETRSLTPRHLAV